MQTSLNRVPQSACFFLVERTGYFLFYEVEKNAGYCRRFLVHFKRGYDLKISPAALNFSLHLNRKSLPVVGFSIRIIVIGIQLGVVFDRIPK